MRKNCDWEKCLKFEAKGQEFANILRSLEQFILTVGQNNFGNKIPKLSPKGTVFFDGFHADFLRFW